MVLYIILGLVYLNASLEGMVYGLPLLPPAGNSLIETRNDPKREEYISDFVCV